MRARPARRLQPFRTSTLPLHSLGQTPIESPLPESYPPPLRSRSNGETPLLPEVHSSIPLSEMHAPSGPSCAECLPDASIRCGCTPRYPWPAMSPPCRAQAESPATTIPAGSTRGAYGPPSLEPSPTMPATPPGASRLLPRSVLPIGSNRSAEAHRLPVGNAQRPSSTSPLDKRLRLHADGP